LHNFAFGASGFVPKMLILVDFHLILTIPATKLLPFCKTINNQIDTHHNIDQLDAYAGNFLGLSISRSSKGLYQKVLSDHSTSMSQLKSVVSENQIADHTRRASVSTQNPLVSG
jgi:hypothetical protein